MTDWTRGMCTAIVALGLALGCAAGCSAGDEWGGPQPGADSGIAPGADSQAASPDGSPPPPKKDAGNPPPPKKDAGNPPPPKKDAGNPPPPKKDAGPPPSAYKVAAVQYGTGQAAKVKPACASASTPDLCAVQALVQQADQAGALLVVTPEYGLGQKYYEPTPVPGEVPATSSQWPAPSYVKILSQQAKQLKLFLVVNLLTYKGSKPSYSYYNTQIAFGPAGAVLAVHHKYNLFGKEKTSLTAGNNVFVFSTPLGKVGLLICADIYGSSTMRSKLAGSLQARVVAVSSYWTVSNAVGWYKSYASTWGVYAVVANTTHSPGYGGGIYNPAGKPLAQKVAGSPSIVYAMIPAP